MSPTGASFDVLVPFWGDPDLLYATVDSVRAQSDPDWVLTVVDDCYPDASVAEHFAAEQDPRIRYVRHAANVGITANYRHCQALATGELMMFLGCDDLLRPGFVRTVKAAAAAHPGAATIQVGVSVIGGDGRECLPLGDRVKRALTPTHAEAVELGGEELATSLLRGNWLYWPSLVFRVDAIRRYAFRDGLPIIQDLALLIDMTAAGETLVLEPTTCFSYRRHTGSASSTSLLHGSRLVDERHYYRDAALQMESRGWPRAARTARRRWTSRLHALTLVPSALKDRSPSALHTVGSHAFTR